MVSLLDGKDLAVKKVLDDLLDLINYATFLYCKLDGTSRPAEVLVHAVDVYLARLEVFKDQWRRMTPSELAAGIRLKAARIATSKEIADTDG